MPRLFHCRVAAAERDHIAVAEEKAVARGARADPAAHQPLLAWQAKQLGLGAGGDDQGVRLVRISALTGDAERATRHIDLDRILADELCAYALRLRPPVRDELRLQDR